MSRPERSTLQSGNVVFFIFLAIALFAALMYTLTQTGHRGSAETISQERSRLLATQILDYGEKLSRALERMIRKGISEGDLSFYDPERNPDDAYRHSPLQPEEYRVFGPKGGGVPHTTFSDDLFIPGVGPRAVDVLTGMRVKGFGSDDLSDLVMVLPYVKKSICEQLNRLQDIPFEEIYAKGVSTAPMPFKGEYHACMDDSCSIGFDESERAYASKRAGCFKNLTSCPQGVGSGDCYQAYYVVMER